MKKIAGFWVNELYEKHDYECTNIVAALGDKPKEGFWREATALEKDAMKILTKLHSETNTTYYGYL